MLIINRYNGEREGKVVVWRRGKHAMKQLRGEMAQRKEMEEEWQQWRRRGWIGGDSSPKEVADGKGDEKKNQNI